MGDIFRILELYIPDDVSMILNRYTSNREVIKELGEPIIIEFGQQWIICLYNDAPIGFIGYNEKSILYAYVIKGFRNKGVFNMMYDKLPIQSWNTVASNMSYPIFIKKGFEVIKNYKNCHKLIKL